MQQTLDRRGTTAVKRFKSPAVFICGFISKRWHNSTLYTIAAELLPQCYVSCNNIETTEKGKLYGLNLLENADVMIFFLNEFTLKDEQSLLLLQHAYSKRISVITVRSPRTRLFIEELSYSNDVRPSSLNKAEEHGTQKKPLYLDDSAFRQILRKEFRRSIVYDRLQHEKSMSAIIRNLKKCMGAKVKEPSTASDDELTNDFKHLTNKKSHRKQFQIRTTIKNNELQRARKSQSLCNLPAIFVSPEGKLSTIRTKSLLADGKITKNVIPTLDKLNIRNSEENFISVSSSPPSSLTENDVHKYHKTQYLIFPIKNKTQAPQLIHFPSDVLNNEVLLSKDHWGSDSSLEETVQMAHKIQGNLCTDGFGSNQEESDIEYEDAPYIEEL